MEDVNEAVKAFNCHKKAWAAMSQIPSRIEERIMALEGVVKRDIGDPARNAAPEVATEMPQPRIYASVVPPRMTKIAVRIRIDGAEELQPEDLPSNAKQRIHGAFVICQMRSNDTELFVQSASQREAALNMRQPADFQILRQDFPAEAFGVLLRT